MRFRVCTVCLGFQLFVGHAIKFSQKSPSLWASVPSNPNPSYLQSKEVLLNLSMKCLKLSIQCPQGWRLIIVVVQIRVVQIDATAVMVLTQKERQDETQLITKIDGGKDRMKLN